MTVYRLTAEKFKSDLSGNGAAIYGGRWNPVGMVMLYTSESRALANLELLVHTIPDVIPVGYYILDIDIPETAPLLEITEKQLPEDWRNMEHVTQLIGYDVFKQKMYLGIKVPSASVPHECNYLMDPAHPEFHLIKITGAEPYTFDERLFDATIRVERKTINRPATEEDLKEYGSRNYGNSLS